VTPARPAKDKKATVPPQNWRWYGNHGHFICGWWCRFHLATKVGPWLISTVGQYLPEEASRESIAGARGITLEGRGDARLADFMKKVGYDEIGVGRTFETMVFRAGRPCSSDECGCGLPTTNGHELDFRPYNRAGEATRGHMAMCRKWARRPARKAVQDE